MDSPQESRSHSAAEWTRSPRAEVTDSLCDRQTSSIFGCGVCGQTRLVSRVSGTNDRSVMSMNNPARRRDQPLARLSSFGLAVLIAIAAPAADGGAQAPSPAHGTERP